MDIALAGLSALVLLLLTVAIHYEVLRGTSLLIPHVPMRPRGRILIVIGGILVAHLIEVSLYAVAFYLMHVHPALGRIDGEFSGEALDFFYFSLSCYTTLGIGDLFPHGPLRVVAAVEALNGLVLIGWSASFTYLSMEKFWEDHRRGRARVK
jgi:hypothetical protein